MCIREKLYCILEYCPSGHKTWKYSGPFSDKEYAAVFKVTYLKHPRVFEIEMADLERALRVSKWGLFKTLHWDSSR